MTRQAEKGHTYLLLEKKINHFLFSGRKKELLFQVSGIYNLNFLFEIWPPS
jgi:hypothetical protein